MRIALWNIPVLNALETACIEAGMTVERAAPLTCVEALAREQVDVALVPVLSVLRDADAYALIPGTGLASFETYPFSILRLNRPLDAIQTVAFDPRDMQDVLLARMVLKEYYLATPQFVPVEAESLERVGNEQDAVLWTGPAAPGIASDEAVSLNLGEEWYEHSLRPMVWGVLASRADGLDVEDLQQIHNLARNTAPDSASSTQTRLDEFALEGLEAFVMHLFYTRVLDEVPDLSFMVLPETEAKDE